jgi:hypothetical protein
VQAEFDRKRCFRGHNDGAENRAIVASLTETCKLSGIDPYGTFPTFSAATIASVGR